MNPPATDQRSAVRRARDEEIAAEPKLSPLELPPDARPSSIEQHLAGHRPHPVAVEGIVENGLVRPLNPAVKVLESSRVIIVATQEG